MIDEALLDRAVRRWPDFLVWCRGQNVPSVMHALVIGDRPLRDQIRAEYRRIMKKERS